MTQVTSADVSGFVQGDFVKRGESLLIVGGNATGKTTIADDIRRTVEGKGGKVRDVYSHFPGEFHQTLVYPPAGFIGSNDMDVGLRRPLLDCNLLVVDEVERCLEQAPFTLLALLGHRCEMGRANILTATTQGWKRLLEQPYAPRDGWPSAIVLASLLLQKEDSLWAQYLGARRERTMREIFARMGVVVDPVDGRPLVEQSRAAAPEKGLAVWHKVYTGEKSFR